jgi:hypothetical protein
LEANFSLRKCLNPRGHTYNLGQVEGIISNSVENEVLEPVDNVEELLSQRSHGAGGCVFALLPTAIACDRTGGQLAAKSASSFELYATSYSFGGGGMKRWFAGIACLDGCSVIVRLVMGCRPPSWRNLPRNFGSEEVTGSHVPSPRSGAPRSTNASLSLILGFNVQALRMKGMRTRNEIDMRIPAPASARNLATPAANISRTSSLCVRAHAKRFASSSPHCA